MKSQVQRIKHHMKSQVQIIDENIITNNKKGR